VIDGLPQALADAGIDPAEVDLESLDHQITAVLDAGADALDEYEDLHWGETVDAIGYSDDPRYRGEKLVVLGSLEYVGYRTSKGGEEAVYHHDFGNPPWLVVTEDRRLAVIDGSYTVNRRGIVG